MSKRDGTEIENHERFDDWDFDTMLPDESQLQAMCRKAAKLAISELLKDVWMSVGFSDGEAPEPRHLEVFIHAWDGNIMVRRPFADIMQELAEHNAYRDGGMDDDDADVLAIVRELEVALAMFKGRMRPRIVKEQAE